MSDSASEPCTVAPSPRENRTKEREPSLTSRWLFGPNSSAERRGDAVQPVAVCWSLWPSYGSRSSWRSDPPTDASLRPRRRSEQTRDSRPVLTARALPVLSSRVTCSQQTAVSDSQTANLYHLFGSSLCKSLLPHLSRSWGKKIKSNVKEDK